ncbi:MAG: hypothetical protein J2O47_10135 [Acidimicrobiaceae bacterium]|nr:hypothetical protein [Acidimicrobiaceae bacterium]
MDPHLDEHPQRSHDATDPDYFGSFAGRYEEVLDQTLTVAGVNSTDVARYRILAIPFMLEAFPGSRIVGTDVSADSVERARTIPDSARMHFCRTTELVQVEFDLGYAQGVFSITSPDPNGWPQRRMSSVPSARAAFSL